MASSKVYIEQVIKELGYLRNCAQFQDALRKAQLLLKEYVDVRKDKLAE